MTTNTVSTRRKFFSTAGAAMSAPLALVAGGASAANADGTLARRLAVLEDQNAIRSLVRDYLQRANVQAADELTALFAEAGAAGIEDAVRSVTGDPFDERTVVEIAADGHSATLHMACAVALETPIEAPGCTLLDMARLQGGGLLRHTEEQVLEQTFVRQGAAWKVASSHLSRA